MGDSDEHHVSSGITHLQTYLNRYGKSKDRSVLHVAAELGHLGVVKVCLDLGMDALANETSSRSRTPLHLAVKHGHLSVMNELVSRQENTLVLLDAKRRTPLHQAAKQGHRDAVSLLCSTKGPPGLPNAVNTPDINGLTPLDYAMKDQDIPLMEILLSRYPEFLRYWPDNTVLYNAVSKNVSIEMFSTLLHYSSPRDITESGPSVLCQAIKHCRSDLLELLLPHQRVDHCDLGEGYTALVYAAQHGRLKEMRLLLEHGANPNRTCGLGYGEESPILRAVREGHCECVALLLDFKATPTESTAIQSLVGYALDWGKYNVAELLLEQGMDPWWYRDSITYSPLQIAIRRKLPKIVSLMLEFECPPLYKEKCLWVSWEWALDVQDAELAYALFDAANPPVIRRSLSADSRIQKSFLRDFSRVRQEKIYQSLYLVWCKRARLHREAKGRSLFWRPRSPLTRLEEIPGVRSPPTLLHKHLEGLINLPWNLQNLILEKSARTVPALQED